MQNHPDVACKVDINTLTDEVLYYTCRQTFFLLFFLRKSTIQLVFIIFSLFCNKYMQSLGRHVSKTFIKIKKKRMRFLLLNHNTNTTQQHNKNHHNNKSKKDKVKYLTIKQLVTFFIYSIQNQFCNHIT